MRLIRTPRRAWLTASLALVFALVLAACGGGTDGGDTEPTAGEETGQAVNQEPINIGLIPWQEDIAVTNLWEQLLTDRGYNVEVQQVDVAPVFDGVASGDLDLFLDAWLPNTHSDYWEQYGDEVTDLGVWYEDAPLTWVVPSYVEDVNSIADLQGQADRFGGQIVGIEAGSGLMRISRNEVVPTYELGDSWRVVEGSTSAMLASLDQAIQDEEPIVVTLWQPHYAYAKWDIKNLEDPENALGDPDSLHAIASSSFEEDYPQVATWLENFQLTNAPLAELEAQIEEASDNEVDAAVREWIENNEDLVNSWFEDSSA